MSEVQTEANETKDVGTLGLPEEPRTEAPRVKITKLTEDLELSDNIADQPCWG
jgi:hypothetical protein